MSCTRRLRSDTGITLVEVAAILVVSLAIVGALSPSMAAVVRRTERTAAIAYATNIRDAIVNWKAEVNFQKFTTNGANNGNIVNLLASDGDIPPISGTGDASWIVQVNNATTAGAIHFFEDHLVRNVLPGGSYSTTGGNAWRGAYINAPVDADPWGNRYASNVQYLLNSASQRTVVISAGPDEEIDSAYASSTLTATDDDVMVSVE